MPGAWAGQLDIDVSCNQVRCIGMLLAVMYILAS